MFCFLTASLRISRSGKGGFSFPDPAHRPCTTTFALQSNVLAERLQALSVTRQVRLGESPAKITFKFAACPPLHLFPSNPHSIRHTHNTQETDTRWLPLASFRRPPYSPTQRLFSPLTRSLRTSIALTVLETTHPRPLSRRQPRLHNSRHGFHHQILQAQRRNPCSRKTSTSFIARLPRPTVVRPQSIRRCILRLTTPSRPHILGT